MRDAVATGGSALPKDDPPDVRRWRATFPTAKPLRARSAARTRPGKSCRKITTPRFAELIVSHFRDNAEGSGRGKTESEQVRWPTTISDPTEHAIPSQS